MATPILDSNTQSTISNSTLYSGSIYLRGSSFFNATKAELDSCVFRLVRGNGTPSGNTYARIYELSGTPGNDAIPTGAYISTSDSFDASGLTGVYQDITFTFSGANRIKLEPLKYYFLVYCANVGNFSNSINMALTNPAGGKNIAFSSNDSSWTSIGALGYYFVLYGFPISPFPTFFQP